MEMVVDVWAVNRWEKERRMLVTPNLTHLNCLRYNQSNYKKEEEILGESKWNPHFENDSKP